MRRLLLPLLLPLTACSGTADPAAPVVASVAAVPSPTASSSPTPAAETGPSWKVRRHDHADLDGDGVREDIGYGGTYGPIRVTTVLSGSGERATLQGGYGAIDWWPEGHPDLDGDGQHEIVLSREFSDQRPVVVHLTDGRLEIIRRRDQQPLVYGPSAGPVPGTAHDNDWFVRHGRLVSYRSVGTFPLSSHSFDVPDEYAVHQWSWTRYGDYLQATDEGVWCKGVASAYPAPCGSDLPALLPAVSGTREASTFPGELPDSECGEARVSTVRIPGGPDGSEGRLVRGPGCAESSEDNVYVELDGVWVAATVPSRPFLGSGVREMARGHVAFATWVTADGSIFSRRGPMRGARARAWSWTLDGTVLTPTDLGMLCFDPVRHPRRFGPC